MARSAETLNRCTAMFLVIAYELSYYRFPEVHQIFLSLFGHSLGKKGKVQRHYELQGNVAWSVLGCSGEKI